MSTCPFKKGDECTEECALASCDDDGEHCCSFVNVGLLFSEMKISLEDVNSNLKKISQSIYGLS